jgi:hypothetical protein
MRWRPGARLLGALALIASDRPLRLGFAGRSAFGAVLLAPALIVVAI